MSAEKDVWKKNWQTSRYVLQSSEQLSLLLLIPWFHIVTGILNLLPGICANSKKPFHLYLANQKARVIHYRYSLLLGCSGVCDDFKQPH